MNVNIKIEKNIDLLTLDALYTMLYNEMSKDNIINLIVPVELGKNYLGVAPNIIQLATTWLRYSKSGKLIIDVQTPNDNLLKQISRSEFLFPIIALVWNTNGVFDKDGNNLRNYLKDIQNKVFLSMRKVEALKGDKLLLTNFDHFPEENGILPCFEKNGNFISNESELQVSLKRALKDGVFKNSYKSLLVYEKIEEELNGIVFELMKNTFEWAKSDKYNVPYDPNVRGLLIKFYKKPRTKLLEEYKESLAISNYFKNELLKENSKGELYFLEVSVFDSGAGFVSKYKSLNKEASKLDDVEIIKRCLTKHNTSAKGLDKSIKGLGLDKILQILNGKGFLRIKTERRCIYRNLIVDEVNHQNNNVNNMNLYDWTLNSDKEYTNYNSALGSVITIIYPLLINE